MQPLFETNLNKPEEFTLEAELLLFQPSTPSKLQCVTFQYVICSKSFKTRMGSSLVRGGWQGGDRHGSKKKKGNFRIRGKRLENFLIYIRFA